MSLGAVILDLATAGASWLLHPMQLLRLLLVSKVRSLFGFDRGNCVPHSRQQKQKKMNSETLDIMCSLQN